MILPLYASLEKIDPADRGDLRPVRRRRDCSSTSLCALHAGVFAGLLFTFIPAAGDFINAQLPVATEHMMGTSSSLALPGAR